MIRWQSFFLTTLKKPVMSLDWLRKPPAWLTTLVSFSLLLLVWHLVVTIGDYNHFILPGPIDVLAQVRDSILDGTLPRHGFFTISEVIPGLLIGFLIALPLGYLLRVVRTHGSRAPAATTPRLLDPEKGLRS